MPDTQEGIIQLFPEKQDGPCTVGTKYNGSAGPSGQRWLSPAAVLRLWLFFFFPGCLNCGSCRGLGLLAGEKHIDPVLIGGFTFPSPLTKALSIYLEQAHKFPSHCTAFQLERVKRSSLLSSRLASPCCSGTRDPVE